MSQPSPAQQRCYCAGHRSPKLLDEQHGMGEHPTGNNPRGPCPRPGDMAISNQQLMVLTSHQPPQGNKPRALVLLSSMGARSKQGTGGIGCKSDPRASSKTQEAAGRARGSGIAQCKCLAGPRALPQAGPFMPLLLSEPSLVTMSHGRIWKPKSLRKWEGKEDRHC